MALLDIRSWKSSAESYEVFDNQKKKKKKN